jgi:hypothetical protein
MSKIPRSGRSSLPPLGSTLFPLTNTKSTRSKTQHPITKTSNPNIQISRYPLFISIPVHIEQITAKPSVNPLSSQTPHSTSPNHSQEQSDGCIQIKSSKDTTVPYQSQCFSDIEQFTSFYSQTFTSQIQNNLNNNNLNNNSNNISKNQLNRSLIEPIQHINHFEPSEIHISLSRFQHLSGDDRNVFIQFFANQQLERIKKIRRDNNLEWEQFIHPNDNKIIFVPILKKQSNVSNYRFESIIVDSPIPRMDLTKNLIVPKQHVIPNLIDDYDSTDDDNDDNDDNNNNNKNHNTNLEQPKTEQLNHQSLHSHNKSTIDEHPDELYYHHKLQVEFNNTTLLLNDQCDKIYHSFYFPRQSSRTQQHSNQPNDNNITSNSSPSANSSIFLHLYTNLISQIDATFDAIGKPLYYNNPIPHFSFLSHQHNLTIEGKKLVQNWENQNYFNSNGIKVSNEIILSNKKEELKRYQEGFYGDNNNNNNNNNINNINNDLNHQIPKKSNSILYNFELSCRFYIASIRVQIGPDYYIFPLC